MKLAAKLTISMSIGILAVHLGGAGYRAYLQTALFKADMDRDARALGLGLSHAVERAWETGGEAELLAVVAHANSRQAQIDVRWVNRDAEQGSPSYPRDPAAASESFRSMQPATGLAHLESGDVLITYVPVDISSGVVGAIEVAEAFGDKQRYIVRSLGVTAATTLALVFLCGVVAWVLSAQLIGTPIRALTDRARAIGRGDLRDRVPIEGSDELRVLAAEMNRMCDSLEATSDRAAAAETERSIAMQQLRHFDRLATIGSFASNMAHELGTPINVVEGHAQLIGEKNADDATRKHVRIIEEQSRRMTGIIRQWLDFARRGRSTQGECNVNDVISTTLDMLRPTANASLVRIEYPDPGRIPRAAIGAAPMQQVLLNLVVNAIQAMPNGGLLQLSVCVVSHARRPGMDAEPFIRVQLVDQGVGIDPDLIDRIFEPFFTTKDPGKGTGLGLSIASGIVQEYAGWIEVASTSSEGTTFHIYVPLGGSN